MRHGTASNLAVLCCVEEERLLDATFIGYHRSFSERMCFLRSTDVFLDDVVKMALAEDEEVVEALPA
jgi:hypothetical protein